MKHFRKILIANRGEIAVRIAATLREMGIAVVAVYSNPDAGALHVRAADEAYPLEGAKSAETYLRGDKIIDIARRCGADAIHPGFGFLSENEDFARACADAMITFIGPTPEVIRDMGDKIVAKAKFAAAGVPIVPGWSGDAHDDFDTIAGHAERIGYPVLIKAAAGGGGKGMRVVKKPDELAAGLESARREATAAFGDGRVFLEKYLVNPRHIEVQIFGDHHGNVVHLFERECSIQRRHQKIIEESPSPALSPALREQICGAAVRAAKAIGYTNAGTVEFILSESGEFYFLEVNTRLQVEHPVTEAVTQRDLVRAQVQVAAGQPLPFRQESIRQIGHAIEARIYAEDASRNFMPSVGVIACYESPTGPGVRVDSGVERGSEVTVHYDPMLAKLIVHADTRDEAIERMRRALQDYAVLGVTTNVAFLRDVISHSEFRAGRLHTHFLEQHVVRAPDSAPPEEAVIAAALVATAMGAHAATGPGAARTQRAANQRAAGFSPRGFSTTSESTVADGPWHGVGRWSNV